MINLYNSKLLRDFSHYTLLLLFLFYTVEYLAFFDTCKVIYCLQDN